MFEHNNGNEWYSIILFNHIILVCPAGIEPASTIFQTAAMTTSAKSTCLVEAEGVEPF